MDTSKYLLQQYTDNRWQTIRISPTVHLDTLIGYVEHYFNKDPRGLKLRVFCIETSTVVYC